MRSLFARVGAWCVERPAPVIAVAVLLAIVGAVGALSLRPDGGTDPLVDTGSEAFAATEEFNREFGADPVVVLVRGDLQGLVLTENLGRLLALEGCLSGNAEGGKVLGDEPAPEPCEKIAELEPSRVVYGPATFLNQFAIQAERLYTEQSQAAVRRGRARGRAAYRAALRDGATDAEARAIAVDAFQSAAEELQLDLIDLGVKYGQTGLPRIDDPQYVSSVVFDQSQGGGVPKARFSYLFPSSDAALISIRLEPDLTEEERAEAIDLFRAAVEDPAFKLRGGDYVVSGVPVVVEGLTSTLERGIFVLLGAALVVMALVLALVFGPPLRLLPLAVALAASGIAFGVLALVGGSLTMASIAVLPILIGLAVDYAIQFHARFNEATRSGSSPPRAAIEAAAAGGPVIATAGLATVAGFAVLLLSPIPMVRQFGALLVGGIVLAFVLALTASLAILSLAARRARETGKPTASWSSRIAPARRLPPLDALRARRERLTTLGRDAGRRALALSIATPGRVLLVAGFLAVAGWAAGTRTEVISDIRELVPGDLPELQNVDVLQDETGVSGEIAVTVTAADVTDPEVIAWMGEYKRRVLELGGFSEGGEPCLASDARICPAIALPDLFGGGRSATDPERIDQVLSILPPYFSQAVVETDPETGDLGNTAVIAFGIKVMPFDEQKELIDDIRAAIDPPGVEGDPPPGVEAQVVGLPVLAADANAALSDNRYVLTAVGLLAVAVVLLAVYGVAALRAGASGAVAVRSAARRALVPLVPIVFATGWSSLVLELAGVPLNPMSATLGALVIAIATEFSVLLSSRYEEERARGASVGQALRLTYSRTGAAVMASGVTAIAGFAALIASDIRMLSDFGLVTVFDLGVALAGVMLVLPAALVWAEGGFAPLGAVAERARRRADASAAPG